jgi:lipopolysaccharide/colanic/teichoic acid biosynthesis glycosyltransferase
MSSISRAECSEQPALDLIAGRLLKSPWKRAIDLALTLPLLAFLAPLFAAIALLLKLQDGGPVFHARRVIGPAGDFDAVKFRTMRPDADLWLARHPILKSEFERNFKLANDPRVTPLGRFLRRYSLDELPQLFNVVRGQMSLVGPRMITAAELDKYGAHRDLLRRVKPGLTGYWQVNGRQTVGYEQRVEMDMFYIHHWTIGMDVAIILQTPLKILKKEGAY